MTIGRGLTPRFVTTTLNYGDLVEVDAEKNGNLFLRDVLENGTILYERR